MDIGSRDEVVRELVKVETSIRRLQAVSRDPTNRVLMRTLLAVVKRLKKIILDSKGAKR